MAQIWATEGTITTFGQTFGQTNLLKLKARFRMVQPNSLLDIDPDMTAGDVVLTGFFGSANLYDRPGAKMRKRASELIETVRLQRVQKHSFNTLSTGERMRCLVARALAVEPELLILDEPAAGLDLRARELVLSSLDTLMASQRGLTLVMITHHLEELPRSISNVLLLKEGSVVAQGPPRKVLTGPVLSKAYECSVRVRRLNGAYHGYVALSRQRLRSALR